MNFFSKLVQEVEAIPGEVEGLFTGHETFIHTAIADAQTALSVGATIAAVTLKASADGTPNPVVQEMGKLSAALTTVSATANNLATASTLNSQIATLASGANSLITSGNINVKSATSQASLTNTVNTVVSKVNTVIGSLAVAAAATSSAPQLAGSTK